MKSGLLMSMPSAMKATLTPVPSTMVCACGTEVSENAVFVTCSASGSSSGLAGSLGQTELSGTTVAALTAVWIACFCNDPKVNVRSGTTAATDGSEARPAACAGVTVAENALIELKLCTLRTPARFARAISGD